MKMSYKWKDILKNWINCYLNDSSQPQQCIAVESLLAIISKLRENLNLDESKSSTLDAHTIEQFIFEKYPEFKFESGTTVPANDEDVGVVASLLLYFVCVTSKNVDLKNVMCSKLGQGDQETILRFSKCLMECSSVTYQDVLVAIKEACGQDVAESSTGHSKVAETPPALRSLHSEVRRLQAALDAERFDRNYLQEELSRINLRLEKLLKEKENAKLEIVNLKAKISLCCGEEGDMHSGDAAVESAARLTRQLQDMEERLVATQGHLDDAQYERDTYRTKLDELKQERNKWLEISQIETSRAGKLADELETERRTVQSLKDLVVELRQYNRNNGLDTSQLECDDTDASIHSIQNASICSEACANVIEVQLVEERAKIVGLQQQIQCLQDQLSDLQQKTDDERKSLEQIISNKDDDIFNLKHRINEEIEEKSFLKCHYEESINKLNNDMNSLEQKLKDNSESSRVMIEQKLQEIKTLQEDKLSLLQSLSDETTRLENIIKDLKRDLDTEKNLNFALKDDYECQLMKLNEKVSNRNNELVELQNKVFEKGEAIEQLQIELRKEQDMKEKLEIQMTNLREDNVKVSNDYQQKMCEAQELQRRLQQNVAIFQDFNREIDDLKYTNSELVDKCRILEESKAALMNDVQNLSNRLEQIQNEKQKTYNQYLEEKELFEKKIEEKQLAINELQNQLRDEKQYKARLINELTLLQQAKGNLSEHVNVLNADVAKLKAEIHDKDKTIAAIDLYLKEERHSNKNLKTDFDIIKDDFNRKNNELVVKESELKAAYEKIENETKRFLAELREKDDIIERLNTKQLQEINDKNEMADTLNFLKTEKDNLHKEFKEATNTLLQLQRDHENLSKINDNHSAIIDTLKTNLENNTKKYAELKDNFDTQTSKLMAKLNITEKVMKEYGVRYKTTIEDKDIVIQKMQIEIDNLKKVVDTVHENTNKVEKEKEALTRKLEDEMLYKNNIEKEYQNLCISMKDNEIKFNEEMSSKNKEINSLYIEVESLLQKIDEKNKEIDSLQSKLISAEENAEKYITEKNLGFQDLVSKLQQLKLINDKLDEDLKSEISSKSQAIEDLQYENLQLQLAIEKNNINHDALLTVKDQMFEQFQEQIKTNMNEMETAQKEYGKVALTWEKTKAEFKDEIAKKSCEIANLYELNKSLEAKLEVFSKEKIDLENEIVTIRKLGDETQQVQKATIDDLITEINHFKAMTTDYKHDIETLKQQLDNEKTTRESLEIEKSTLTMETERIMEELYREQSNHSTCLVEKSDLANEKNNLTQALLAEKSIRQTIEEEKESLITENENLSHQLEGEINIKNLLLQERECLTQQLVDERAVRDLIENEKQALLVTKEELDLKFTEEKIFKDSLEQEKNKLIKEKEDIIAILNQQLVEEVTAKQLLEDEKIRLVQNFDENKAVAVEVFKAKDCLSNENVSLKQNIAELTATQDALLFDKEALCSEKEELIKSLHEEKAVRDQYETENKKLSSSLQEINNKLASELNEKQNALKNSTVELENTALELKQLKTDLKKHEDNTSNISLVLNSGLHKLLDNIKQIGISNEVLEKLIPSGNVEELSSNERCNLLINISNTLINELSHRSNFEEAFKNQGAVMEGLKDKLKQKQVEALELQTEVKRLEKIVHEKIELAKQLESYSNTIESKTKEIQSLELENQSLNDSLNNAKAELERKVYSLQEKLVDNEDLTDKLKTTYECQIENLNVMVNKLTNYLKDKTVEIESLRNDKKMLQEKIEDNAKVIESLEEKVKSEKQTQEKLISDFEAESQIFKNMVTVTESVMEDQKHSFTKEIDELKMANEKLNEQIKTLEEEHSKEMRNIDVKIQEKNTAFQTAFKELSDIRTAKEALEKEFYIQKDIFKKQIDEEKLMTQERLQTVKDNFEKNMIEKEGELQKEFEGKLSAKNTIIQKLEAHISELNNDIQKYQNDIAALEKRANDLQISKDNFELELLTQINELTKSLENELATTDVLKSKLPEKLRSSETLQEKLSLINNEILDLVREKQEYVVKYNNSNNELKRNELESKEELDKLMADNTRLVKITEENKNVIMNLEQLMKHELEKNKKLVADNAIEKLNLENKCYLLHEYQTKAKKQLQDNEKEIKSLTDRIHALNSNENKMESEIVSLKDRLKKCEEELIEKSQLLSTAIVEKDAIIDSIKVELEDERKRREMYQKEIERRAESAVELQERYKEAKNKIFALTKDCDNEYRDAGHQYNVHGLEKLSSHKLSDHVERDYRDQLQVSSPTSDLTHSSMDSLKTISDLEKIVNDKNRIITTLQSDVTYLKTLTAESENKLLDVKNELEAYKDNCEQLSSQLKKTVQQKNEELADLKRQLSKMSVTENRASQIIKVSAKYQAIILRRIAEIKSNTILKELTNFGNANCEPELKRSLTSGSITMEDLENFLETTDRHLKRCTEKQLALQKERDRLTEVNRINESEIINMKKFLTELSVSFKTFSSVKDLYTQKMSRVVSLQRTVRREILNLDGRITDATMCKLERGYAAVMQDLAECSMNLERWVERCIGRTISPEKIKQAFTSDTERTSIAPGSLQNASLDVQLDELEKSFQKLLEEIVRAQKGEGAKDTQAITVMEVRAEYEDKLNRMKAKMKELYQEQISIFKEKQKEEIATLERELQKARDKLTESSKAYEKHIKSLTTELWNVGEKFLMKKDEAEWLRKQQRSSSLMSLQHVHSSGLVAPSEAPSRPSDAYSLRSLPVNNNAREKNEGRGLHMSDEEGEVFDNRWLKELGDTPSRKSTVPGQRYSELRWRNSLCPPHLKSSYPAETQFAPVFDEEDIKCANFATSMGEPSHRKEVGITAYKKPGPPTPSKQAGRLSATDSELRESLRVNAEPHTSRKTSTPSRLRSLFRRNDTADNTPRKRLSNIFRKK